MHSGSMQASAQTTMLLPQPAAHAAKSSQQPAQAPARLGRPYNLHGMTKARHSKTQEGIRAQGIIQRPQ
jgi:hypothetical protein